AKGSLCWCLNALNSVRKPQRPNWPCDDSGFAARFAGLLFLGALMGDLFEQLWQLALAVFDSQALMQMLSRPELLVATFIMLTEPGLLIGFFLRGDSLPVTVELVFHNLIHVQGSSPWLLPLLLVLLSAAAIVGDSVGYAIGFKAGPRIFKREKSFFFRKDHLLAAQAFYERHGGKAILLARFMPFLRPFDPVVAGVGQINYLRVLMFNLVGRIR